MMSTNTPSTDYEHAEVVLQNTGAGHKILRVIGSQDTFTPDTGPQKEKDYGQMGTAIP